MRENFLKRGGPETHGKDSWESQRVTYLGQSEWRPSPACEAHRVPSLASLSPLYLLPNGCTHAPTTDLSASLATQKLRICNRREQKARNPKSPQNPRKPATIPKNGKHQQIHKTISPSKPPSKNILLRVIE
jgi:hypothetical protein